ncbi:hypothetical protein LTR09_004700 [Extremus antarcticus]|uniref:Uncharacterized protein n=1 Tax=Extremus antarcticus TaxID=702011 RepID=A0AAJ0GAH5_9PEZI|nr:hypothetical protein LTR09_004700 [Extremus antarcticus]
MEDHPFSAKFNCGDYTRELSQSSTPCGLGGFYCARTPDGIYLERLHVAIRRCSDELVLVAREIEKVSLESFHFQSSADRANVPQEARKRHPRYSQLEAQSRQVVKRREQILRFRHGVVGTTQAAFVLYKRLTQERIAAGLPPALPKDDFIQFERRQKEHAMFAARRLGERNEALRQLNQTLMPPASVTQRENTQVSRIQCAHNALQPYLIGDVPSQLAAQDVLEDRAVKDAQQHHAQTISVKKRGQGKQAKQGKRAAKKEDTPGTEAAGLRRSTRTRGKQVRYADSQTSSIESRETSPSKSDISTFSLAKSEVSGSPEKEITPRRGGKQRAASTSDSNRGPSGGRNLGSVINDWSRTRNSAGTATHNRPADHQSPKAQPPSRIEQLGQMQQPPQMQRPSQAQYPSQMPHQQVPRPQTVDYRTPYNGVARQANMMIPPSLDQPKMGPNFIAKLREGGSDLIKRRIHQMAQQEGQALQAQQSRARPATRHGPPSSMPHDSSSAYGLQHAAMPNFLPPVPTAPSQLSSHPAQSGRFHMPDSPLQYSASMVRSMTSNQPLPAPPSQQVLPTSNSSIRAADGSQWLLNKPLYNALNALASSLNTGNNMPQLPGSAQEEMVPLHLAPRFDSMAPSTQVGGTGYSDLNAAEAGQYDAMIRNASATERAPSISSLNSQNQSTIQGSAACSDPVMPVPPAEGMYGYGDIRPGQYVGDSSNHNYSETAPGLGLPIVNDHDQSQTRYQGARPRSDLVMPLEHTSGAYSRAFNHPGAGPLGSMDAHAVAVKERPRHGIMAGLPIPRPAPRPDYEQFRRSFSATADLTPPPGSSNKSFNSDPRKRSLPLSSPDESPTKKRMRLSLPGEEAMPNVFDRTFPSDFRKPASKDDSSGDAPTPAPVLIPKGKVSRWGPLARSTMSQTLGLAASVSDLSVYEAGDEEEGAEGGLLEQAEGYDELFESQIDWIQPLEEGLPGLD